MGGAKFMGRDTGLPYSKERMAFECFFYWLVGGLFLSAFLSILIFPKPNFIFPIFLYVFGLMFFWIRYIKMEKKDMERNG